MFASAPCIKAWLRSLVFSPYGRDKGAGCGSPFFRSLLRQAFRSLNEVEPQAACSLTGLVSRDRGETEDLRFRAG
jgi:hypothetical protein